MKVFLKLIYIMFAILVIGSLVLGIGQLLGVLLKIETLVVGIETFISWITMLAGVLALSCYIYSLLGKAQQKKNEV